NGYARVDASGPHRAHVLAFDRGGAVTVATRLPLALEQAGGWVPDDLIDLPTGRWREVITGTAFDGGVLAVPDVLARYPVALLAPEDAGGEGTR
ncbi:MAG TPA: malto-oligosyltrehalose synthase, partial [Micromonosporaceae bacterium]|nr:malto-oligosyltrehalose synthase [Micromonosporaceae bacterium]